MSRDPNTMLFVTGIPRSGTTLAAHLLDQLDDTICLNEPTYYYRWTIRSKDALEFAQSCVADLRNLRRTLIAGGTVTDRRELDGSVPTNYFHAQARRRLHHSPVSWKNSGKHDLLLAVKHNEPLTSVLPELCDQSGISIAAIVRHPVPTILSWQSNPIPLSRGELSPGYRFWDDANELRQAGGSIVEIQAGIYELYCRRYLALRDRIRILRYEDLVGDGQALSRVTGRSCSIRSRDVIRPAAKYDQPQLSMVKRALTRRLSCACEFYPDLEKL
jgi:hypothetical protein